MLFPVAGSGGLEMCFDAVVEYCTLLRVCRVASQPASQIPPKKNPKIAISNIWGFFLAYANSRNMIDSTLSSRRKRFRPIHQTSLSK